MVTIEEKKIIQETLEQLYEGYKVRHSGEICDTYECKMSKLKCNDKEFRYVKKYTVEHRKTIYWDIIK